MSVSFIVAAKDEEAHVGRCLRSLVPLLGPEDEVILVDDGSTDDTSRIAASVKGLRLRLITNRSSVGRAEARNEAVRASRGTFLAIQDADDFALRARLHPLKQLVSNSDLVAAGGQCISFTRAGMPWLHETYPLESTAIRDGLSEGIMTVCHVGSVIRKRDFRRAGGYDSSFARGQDLDLFQRLSSLGPMWNSALNVVGYQHDVWLGWHYWSQTRMSRKKLQGLHFSPWTSAILYPPAQIRRVVTYLRTRETARAALESEVVWE